MTPERQNSPMPDDIRAQLDQRSLMRAYEARPPYQQDEYLRWIGEAGQNDLRQKRIDQMLDELELGGVYMDETWSSA